MRRDVPDHGHRDPRCVGLGRLGVAADVPVVHRQQHAPRALLPARRVLGEQGAHLVPRKEPRPRPPLCPTLGVLLVLCAQQLNDASVGRPGQVVKAQLTFAGVHPGPVDRSTGRLQRRGLCPKRRLPDHQLPDVRELLALADRDPELRRGDGRQHGDPGRQVRLGRSLTDLAQVVAPLTEEPSLRDHQRVSQSLAQLEVRASARGRVRALVICFFTT